MCRSSELSISSSIPRGREWERVEEGGGEGVGGEGVRGRGREGENINYLSDPPLDVGHTHL